MQTWKYSQNHKKNKSPGTSETENKEERTLVSTRRREEAKREEQMDGPLDALEGAAGHVHDAACRPGNCPHQAFTDALKEACCPLLPGSWRGERGLGEGRGLFICWRNMEAQYGRLDEGDQLFWRYKGFMLS